MNIVLEIDGVRHKYVLDTDSQSNPCENCSLVDLCDDLVYSFCLDLDGKEGQGHFIKEHNNEKN